MGSNGSADLSVMSVLERNKRNQIKGIRKDRKVKYQASKAKQNECV